MGCPVGAESAITVNQTQAQGWQSKCKLRVMEQVLRIESAWKGKAPFAKLDSNYHHALLQGKPRSDIKPLDIVQPEGPSFTV